MATDIVMPRLSDSMEEGTILRWLKSPGDQVALGEELVEIETDKANMVYEAPGTGTLIEIVAEEGDTLPIGQVIARVGEADEKPSGEGAAAEREAAEEADDDRRSPSPVHGSAASQRPRVRAAEAPSALSPSFTSSTQRSAGPAEPAQAPPTVSSGDGRVKASPLARRIATENGLDLSALAGSGPGGRIIKADVERAIAAGPAPVAPPAPATAPSPGAPAEPTPGARERPETAKGAVSHEDLTKLQQTVARRMAESKATAPHFYLSAEVDMTPFARLREEWKKAKETGGRAPSFLVGLCRATIQALAEFPRMNAVVQDESLIVRKDINLGVAVDTDKGLLVPVIRRANEKSVLGLGRALDDLAARARSGKVTADELSGGSFTVSNPGLKGNLFGASIINQPQVGILRMGEIVKRAVVRELNGEDVIVMRQMMYLTLSYDHRVIDGVIGNAFLHRVRELLEEAKFSL